MKGDQKDFLAVLGYLFLGHGKKEKALILFEALQEIFPSDPQIAKYLSYTYLMTGKYEEAVFQAEKYLRKASKPEKNIGYLFKSKAFWGLGQKDAARQMMTRFLKAREENRAENS